MTKKEIYRKLSLKYHPDVGGDEEIFKKINEAYEVGIKEIANIYRDLEEEEIELTIKTSDKIDIFIFNGKEYNKSDEVYFRYGMRTSKGYDTHTLNGMTSFWGDSLVDRIEKIKYIDTVIVGSVEIKITIRWINKIKGKTYWQVSSINGKFFSFEDYSNAIMESLKIKAIGEKVKCLK